MGDWGRAPTNPTRDSSEKTSNVQFQLVYSELFLLLINNFDLEKFLLSHVWGPLKCGGPCSAEHVRTLVNPALCTFDKFWQKEGRQPNYPPLLIAELTSPCQA